jgi:diacylglycerol O-acyltransferase / wax synthase
MRWMAEKLSPADRSSLNAERGPVNMAIGGVVLLERGPGVTYDALCTRIAERIHLLPRYRQRLEQPPLGLANPVWVDDEHFDVHWHVRLSRLPDPGGDAELAAFVGREFSRLMDRSRPLWELHIVEGLVGDRVAVIPKMHHALADGAGAVGIGLVLLDPGPEPLPVEAPTEEWTPRPYLMHRHLARIATSPLNKAQRLVLETTTRLLESSPRSAAADLRRSSELIVALARSRPPAPRLPFNRPITANRSWAFTSAPLAPVKAAGKRAGGTVNDAILAAVTGMLATYLEEAGIAPDSLVRDPVALVPVNIRRDGELAEGNKISVVFVDLPIGEPDPHRRIELINERMTRIRGSARVRAGALMVDMTGFAPPLFSSVLARALPEGGAFNLVVSNVPGPQFPLYLNGSRVLAVHPFVSPNPADQGLNVGVFSYDGSVCFGLTGDKTLDPPVARAAAGLDAAIADLVALAQA